MLFDAKCVVCGAWPGPVCATCESELVTGSTIQVDGVVSCRSRFVLDEASRSIIAALKYRKQRRLARWLASHMAELVPRGADAIAWVPATPERRRSRGFDQARELARVVQRQTEVPAINVLCRDSHDGRQTGQSRQARLSGPALIAKRPSPRFVVLIDDVLTTGSSIRVAAQTLRNAGAERIVAVVAASTPLKRDLSLHDLTNRCSVRGWT